MEILKSSVDENTLCNPVGIYGNLKFAAEFLIKSFKQTYNLDYNILDLQHCTVKDVLVEE